MNIIALDMDGVVGDGYIGRVLDVLFKTDLTEDELWKYGVRLHDVESLNKHAVLILLNSIGDEDQFVLVSSWISKLGINKTYRVVEKIFQTIKPRVNAYFHGQIDFGCGGVGREYEFLKYVGRLTNEQSLPSLEMFAIDDSGERHFPLLTNMRRVVAPRSLVGFDPYNSLHLRRLLGMYCVQYPESWFDAQYKQDLPKAMTPSDFELLFQNISKQFYQQLQNLERLKVY